MNATKLKTSTEEKTKSVWETQTSIKEMAANISSIIFLLSGSISIAIGGVTIKTDAALSQNLSKFVPGILEIILSVAGFNFTKTWEKSSNKQSEIEGLSIHELQYRTSNILTELKKFKQDKKIVILFDELDHYDYQKSNACNTETLLLTLKGLKLLFQNVSASFVFLIGEETYRQMNNNSYLTIATDRFFLAKAGPNELDEFVLKVFKNPPNKQRGWLETYSALKIRESNGNFYKLIALLRDDFDYSKEGLILKTKKISHTEEVMAILIRASFRFITSYSQRLSKGAINDEIFNGLMSVVDNYYRAVLGNPEKLVISSSQVVESAITSYVDYIFSTAKKLNPNITMPSYDKGGKAYSSLDWPGIQNLPEPEILIREVTKAILPEEKDLEGLYKKIYSDLEFLANKLSIRKISNVAKWLREIANATLIPETPLVEYAEEISEAYKIIAEIPFQQRPVDFKQTLTNKIFPAGNNLQDLIANKYFFQDTNPLVVKRISPVNVYNSNDPEGNTLVFELGERHHSGGSEFSSFVTIAHPLPANKFVLKFKAYMQPDSIVDIVFGTKPWTEEISQREFLMVRLDTRGGSRDGIFYKNSMQPTWHERALPKQNIHTESLKDVTFWVRLNNREISLNKPRWNSITAKEHVNKIYWWGVANELKRVDLVLFLDSLDTK